MFVSLYSDDNRYEYNGKEYERVAQLLDYGWRWYDPVIGRWNGVDPLADDAMQINMSPFAYVWNNPILLIDPDGLCPKCPPSPDPSSPGATIRHSFSQGLQLAAYPYKQVGGYISSGLNKLNNMFSPGEPQQHSGENWVIEGKGSPSGYEVPGSNANPDGDTRIIEGFFDILSPGSGGSNALRRGILNPIMAVDDLNNTVNTLGEQFNSKNNRNGTTTEVPPGNRIEERPSYGGKDTIETEQGRVERQRSMETGIVLERNID